MRRIAALFSLVVVACSSDPAGIREVDVTENRALSGLEDQVHVVRTEMNVPHIYARNQRDLYRVFGYVMAQDRYVNIELFRRFGAGTLGELLGDLGLAVDAQSRGQGFAFVAERLWMGVSPELRERMEAFAAGINLYVQDVKVGRYDVPEELEIVAGLRRIDDAADLMQPMKGEDIAAVAAVIVSRLGYEASDLTDDVVEERMRGLFADGPLAELRRAGVFADMFDAVAPVHAITQVEPGKSSASNGLGVISATQIAKVPPVTDVDAGRVAFLDRVARRARRFQGMLGIPQGEDIGSNSWAVGTSGTGGRGTLLANDGHLPLSVPTLFYQGCLDASYFGDADDALCGLFFPGLPFLAVGTNSHVAWGQTYEYGDITDWYEEKITLGADGLPATSEFKGAQERLVRFDETYRVGQEGDFASTVDVTWPRWTTFDGRWLVSVEGSTISASEAARGDRAAVLMQGDYIVPGDTDGDGVITGISFDWTAFDVTNTLERVDGFSRSRSVEEFREVTRDLVAYAQNVIVADRDGEVMYTAYHRRPCRTELERGASGWTDGSSPRRLLDGTRYGGFDVNGDGCVIPFEAGPRVVSPAAGFVHTANHDALGNGLDGDLSNDEHYVGGPYALGYRARTIDAELSRIVASGQADVAAMQQLQGDIRSPLGAEYGPRLVETYERAVALVGTTPSDEADQRLLAIYEADKARIDEAVRRVQAWLTSGAIASSGVDTFYEDPTEQERVDAVATMITNAWLRHLAAGVFGDEGIQFVIDTFPDRMIFRTLNRLFTGRGAGNPGNLASFNPATNESAFFDVRDTAIVETSHEVALSALVTALDALTAPRGRGVDGGFGTADMSQWLWGLKHQVRFEPLLSQVASDTPEVALLGVSFGLNTETLPLAKDLPSSDQRAALRNFPRGGDFFVVDAAVPSMVEDRWYNYSNGPVMRMVIHLDDGQVTGQNILPGGQSGNAGDDHFADQAAMWLGNETVPIRYDADAVVEGAVGQEVFTAR